MWIRYFLYLLFVCSLTPPQLCAQEADLPDELKAFLANNELVWHAPSVDFRLHRKRLQAQQATDFRLSIRKQNVDVLYYFYPTATDTFFVPHVHTATTIVQLASNEEDSYIAAHGVDPAVVDTVYHADWAQTFFFSPKNALSEYKDGQMTAVYRDGVGMAFVFLLFDDAPLYLEELAQTLRFRERPQAEK
ncbi:MAG: hypothetical protein AAGJ82_01365 [Bacteroidota bacterium]